MREITEQTRNATATRGYWLAIAAVLLLAAMLRAWLLDPFAIHHADEMMQYLEQAKRIAEGHALTPWEWRLGMRNALIPQFLAAFMALGDWIAPEDLLPIWLARCAYAALCSLTLAGAWGLGAGRGRAHALLALFVAAVWYQSAFFDVQLLSESAATALLACAAALLLGDAPSPRALVTCGFLLALGALLRLQYAPFAAILAIARLRANRQAWHALSLGALAALALGALSDLADHRVPYLWALIDLDVNLGQNRAAHFGTSPPSVYLALLIENLGPFAPFILAASVVSGARYRPLVLALWTNILVHSLIGHKEYRFIWLSVLLILVLAAIASLDLARRAFPRAPASALSCALVLTWTIASTLALRATHGLDGFRGGGPIAETAHAVADHGDVCGLAIPRQWRANVSTAFFRRPLALYYTPYPVMSGLAPFPAKLGRAADAAIAMHAPGPGWREADCRQNFQVRVCLFIRPGPCDPAAAPDMAAQHILDSLEE